MLEESLYKFANLLTLVIIQRSRNFRSSIFLELQVKICVSFPKIRLNMRVVFQMDLVTSDWDECALWLGSLKRMIKTKVRSLGSTKTLIG